MGIARFLVAAAVAALPATLAAQTTDRALTPIETAVACASPTSNELPENPIRVTGAQDTVARSVFGETDLLVLNRGTNDGVQVNQQYYVRRAVYSGTTRRQGTPDLITTGGWIRVVSTNEIMAIAAIEHFCGAIFEGDYLEPFVAPSLPAVSAGEIPFADLDFGNMGRILLGTENHSSGGRGDLMTIDRGSDQGIVAGARFAIYRDVRLPEVPLASVGEGVVLTVGKARSLAQITSSRDAVIAGDYVVLRK